MHLWGLEGLAEKDAVIWDVSFSGIKKNRHGNVHVMAQDFQQMEGVDNPACDGLKKKHKK